MNPYDQNQNGGNYGQQPPAVPPPYPPQPPYPQQPVYPPYYGAPIPPYSYPSYPVPGFYAPSDPRKPQMKREIRKIGSMVGLAVLAFWILQQIFGLLISSKGLSAIYRNNASFYNAVYIFISIFSVLLPFALIGLALKPREGYSKLIPFRRVDPVTGILSVLGGTGCCMLANLLTSIFISFLRSFGLNPQAGTADSPTAMTPVAIVVAFVGTALIPALNEEFSMRGIVLQSLKKYGFFFSIFATALIFGLLHGNLVQTPFAILVGLVLCYVTLKTNSLWPAILIHFLNNGTSVLIETLQPHLTTAKLGLLNAFAIYGWILVGAIALLIMKFVRPHFYKVLPQSAEQRVLTFGEKLGAFLGNVPMILALILLGATILLNLIVNSMQ